MPVEDNRDPQLKAAHDAIALLAEVTITPEIWIKGIQVDAASRGFPPYTLTRRTFDSPAEAIQAKADFDTMCAAGFNPLKAYRMCIAVPDPGLDAAREELLRRLLGP